MRYVNKALEDFSIATTRWAGSSWAFAIAAAVVLSWAISGPIFNYSETWQLVINTGTTIVTFLMVFLIQRSQNKESLAVQVKLNELLAAHQGASNNLINIEEMSEEEITRLHERFSTLSSRLERLSDQSSSHSIAEAQVAVETAHRTVSKMANSRSARR